MNEVTWHGAHSPIEKQINHARRSTEKNHRCKAGISRFLFRAFSVCDGLGESVAKSVLPLAIRVDESLNVILAGRGLRLSKSECDATAYLRESAAGDTSRRRVLSSPASRSPPPRTALTYIKAMVSDRASQVNGRMWKATWEIFNAMPESGFIRIRGRLESYQNNLQLILEQFWLAEEGPTTSRTCCRIQRRTSRRCAGS